MNTLVTTGQLRDAPCASTPRTSLRRRGWRTCGGYAPRSSTGGRRPDFRRNGVYEDSSPLDLGAFHLSVHPAGQDQVVACARCRPAPDPRCSNRGSTWAAPPSTACSPPRHHPGRHRRSRTARDRPRTPGPRPRRPPPPRPSPPSVRRSGPPSCSVRPAPSTARTGSTPTTDGAPAPAPTVSTPITRDVVLVMSNDLGPRGRRKPSGRRCASTSASLPRTGFARLASV